MSNDTLTQHDISAERWREYEWADGGERHTYRIDAPATLYQRPDGTTHRVVDAEGTVHCVPAPGLRGCVLRWTPRKADEPVQF